ncbi:MAG: DUF1854 domain-containing protein [Limnochordia bacterium]|jgi:hypothetical protein
MAVKQREHLTSELNLLPAREIEARLNSMKDLEVSVNGQIHEKVRLVRSFPLSDERRFIVLLDAEGEEIGIIENLDACRPEVEQLFSQLLEDTYLVPVITKVHSLSYTGLVPVWDVETDRGPHRIEMRSRRDLTALGTRIMLRDADGNRYEIPDYTRLDLRSRRIVEEEI